MNTIDLIVLLVLAVAVWNGWRKGFIVQVCSLLAIVAGLWCAAHYGHAVGEALQLDESVRTAGGFAVVLVAAVLVVAVAARAVRGIFRFAGLGTFDLVLGIAVSVFKYLLVVSALFAAFDKFNADYSLVSESAVASSRCYRPVLRLSEVVFPWAERLGDRMSQPEDSEESGKQQEA